MFLAKRVVVGMSGGVDSAVSALLLKEQGYDVLGVFMKNWEEKDDQGRCRAEEDYADVREVCNQIGIPYYTVNFTKDYEERVFAYFLRELSSGRTPNPDILCNTQIKFHAFLDFALKSGADHLATGHFAQLHHGADGTLLLRGKDENKDQTYFLHGLGQKELAHALFPVGHLQKSQVRELAQKHGLKVAAKKDSTGICFIGERNFRAFLSQHLPLQPGDMVTPSGQIVGQHQGLAFYTLGQRRGLGIGGRGDGRRWFVVEKDLAKNRLIVEQGEDSPLLYASTLRCQKLHFVSGDAPAVSFDCTAKIRYRQPDQACRVTLKDDATIVTFSDPQRAITPGQYIVLYQGEVCLGGGIIEEAIR